MGFLHLPFLDVRRFLKQGGDTNTKSVSCLPTDNSLGTTHGTSTNWANSSFYPIDAGISLIYMSGFYIPETKYPGFIRYLCPSYDLETRTLEIPQSTRRIWEWQLVSSGGISGHQCCISNRQQSSMGMNLDITISGSGWKVRFDKTSIDIIYG